MAKRAKQTSVEQSPAAGVGVKKRAEQTSVEQSPEDVLKAFFAAMCKWERAAYKASRASERAGQGLPADELLRQKLAILGEYCTPKRRVYAEAVCYSSPPEYDPRTEPITRVVAESETRVVVYTQQQTGFEHERRFVLLRRGGRWLVDNKQWRGGGEKWERDIL